MEEGDGRAWLPTTDTNADDEVLVSENSVLPGCSPCRDVGSNEEDDDKDVLAMDIDDDDQGMEMWKNDGNLDDDGDVPDVLASTPTSPTGTDSSSVRK